MTQFEEQSAPKSQRNDIIDRLWDSWWSLLQEYGADEPFARSLFADLTGRYKADGRYYHNLAHLKQILQDIEFLKPFADDLNAIRLAAWFHDAIYNPHSATNEHDSARYAEEALAPLHLPETTVSMIHTLIDDTRHQHAPKTGDGMILVDADLATLGAAEAVYEDSSKRVRREYGHVSDAQYALGRMAQLQVFLRRAHIYYTAAMRARCEAQARANMEREYARWEHFLASGATTQGD
ncbi:MAG: hypothetical protein M9941_17190 [Anaerolineae bacterium]|nr:hypothetical protein [Anaerolineae bacterium]